MALVFRKNLNRPLTFEEADNNIVELDTRIKQNASDLSQTNSQVSSLATSKVDKVTGQGLSDQNYTSLEKTKLSNITDGATKNSSDDYLLSRTNHTGTQLADTISNFAEAVRNVKLAGLSVATATALAVTDSVIAALGKLQAQITGKVSKAGDKLSGQLKFASIVNVADSATPNVTDAVSNTVVLLGSTAIAGFSSGQSGDRFRAIFEVTRTLKYSSTLVLLGGADLTVAGNDWVEFECLGGSSWRMVSLNRANGQPVLLDKLPLSGGTLSGALNEAPILNVADSATPDIAAAKANTVILLGATTITGFTTAPSGSVRQVVFGSDRSLTYSSSLVLLGGANLSVNANDWAEFVSFGDRWVMTKLNRFNGNGTLQSESGKTSNGEYTKYPDGRLIQTAYFETSIAVTTAYGSAYYGTAAWTYPIAFVGSPAISLTARANGRISYTAPASAPPGPANQSMFVVDQLSSNTAVYSLSWSAIGRWK